MRIAVIEDNAPLSDGIAQAFRAEGHGVDQLFDGLDAITFLQTERVDLIILDINLPKRTGLEVLTDLRRNRNHAPVLLLTARGTLEDKVAGLDLGADDYMTKPFELGELQARARALLRRSGQAISEKFSIGNVELDLGARQLRVDGSTIDLPRREFALAELLFTRAGHVVSKPEILEHLYGTGADVEDNAVEIYIHRLRKKLARQDIEIRTLRGLGYCLRETP